VAKNMKKTFSFFLALSFFLTFAMGTLMLPKQVLAQINPGEPVTNDVLDRLDPLVLENSPVREQFKTPGGILSRLINNYGIPAAGMILFVMIVWGGFEMMTSSVGSKKNAGRERIQAAIIGFILLFSAYWIGQLIQAIFGVKFL
jgi:amino acid transporter